VLPQPRTNPAIKKTTVDAATRRQARRSLANLDTVEFLVVFISDSLLVITLCRRRCNGPHPLNEIFECRPVVERSMGIGELERHALAPRREPCRRLGPLVYGARAAQRIASLTGSVPSKNAAPFSPRK
jgi:hypothetical protein